VALLQLLQVPEGVCGKLLVLCLHLGLALALLLQLARCLPFACEAAGLQQLLAALDLQLVSCVWYDRCNRQAGRQTGTHALLQVGQVGIAAGGA
jgi:hypothetical protein